MSGTAFAFSFPSQYSQYSQYSHRQNRVSGVPLSGTVFHCRLFAHESYRPHRTYKPHSQIGHFRVLLRKFGFQNRHFRVLLSRTVFEIQWTAWTVWTGFQNRDFGVPLSGTAFDFMSLSHYSYYSNYSHYSHSIHLFFTFMVDITCCPCGQHNTPDHRFAGLA